MIPLHLPSTIQTLKHFFLYEHFFSAGVRKGEGKKEKKKKRKKKKEKKKIPLPYLGIVLSTRDYPRYQSVGRPTLQVKQQAIENEAFGRPRLIKH